MFPQVAWRKRFDGDEVDVYISTEGIGIEVDGFHWHQNRERFDRGKVRRLAELGVRLLRIREEPLAKIGTHDVLFSPDSSHKEIMNGLVRRLITLACPELRTRLQEYLQSPACRDEQGYRRILSYLPGPPAGTSFADLYPHLLMGATLSTWSSSSTSAVSMASETSSGSSCH